jgi:poly-gamma-glutamate synthesis protein (capsule biosynthesis protein)
MNILITGDFFVSDAFVHNISISEGLQKLFESSDLNILNLEGPVAEKNIKSRIQKTGPHIINNSEILAILKKLNIHLVTLANNHMMDYGPQALSDTMINCRENLINTVGAGMCLEEAQTPFIFEKGSVKLAVLNFAENEWATASIKQPGTNPLNIIENVRQIKRAREICDLVLVIVHGGHEFYPLPNP